MWLPLVLVVPHNANVSCVEGPVGLRGQGQSLIGAIQWWSAGWFSVFCDETVAREELAVQENMKGEDDGAHKIVI